MSLLCCNRIGVASGGCHHTIPHVLSVFSFSFLRLPDAAARRLQEAAARRVPDAAARRVPDVCKTLLKRRRLQNVAAESASAKRCSREGCCTTSLRASTNTPWPTSVRRLGDCTRYHFVRRSAVDAFKPSALTYFALPGLTCSVNHNLMFIFV